MGVQTYVDTWTVSGAAHLFHTVVGVGECQEIIVIVRGYRMDGLCDNLI